MLKIRKRYFLLLSFFLIPLVTLASPDWLKIAGVSPCWSILWLLPWSLEVGPSIAFLTAICLGLMQDGIIFAEYSQVPILAILGYWWGNLGKNINTFDTPISLGLLSWIGSILFGFSIWIQSLFLNSFMAKSLLLDWGIKTLLSQSIVTALLAPLICSQFLNWLRKNSIKKFIIFD